MNVSRQFLAVSILVNDYSFKPPLEEMPGPLPFDIEVGCIRSIDMMKYLRQVSPWRLEEKMVMISHEAIGVDNGSIAIMG
jgi:hypothetical protein